MDFSEIWNDVEIGARVKVSKGGPPPSTNVNGNPYKAWQSHNFTATLTNKIDGDYRCLSFTLDPNELGNEIGYNIFEGLGHTFTLVI